VKWLQPDQLNINRFWSRPGTEAERLPGHLPGGVIKERSTMLSGLWRDLNVETTKKWLGWEGHILVDKEGHTGTVEGRNHAYKAMTLRGDYRLGDYVRVRAVAAERGFLRAQAID